MTESLRRLLQHPIDYAGLFPPAELGMQDALKEYGAVMESKDEWIINRFLCPVGRLHECFEALGDFENRQTGEAPWLDFGVIGTPLTNAATASQSLEKDMSEVKLAFQHGDVTTFEIKMPLGEELLGCAGALKKHFNWFDERDVEVYVELPWGQGIGEAMTTLASEVDGVGFKARTGGAIPEHYPDIRELAAFICDVAGLEAMYKFTAGLHKPIRHYDSSLSTYQHGFLNVMVASALASIQNAPTSEVESVLNVQDPSEFIFTDKTVEVLEKRLTIKDLDEWWLFFGGFGSCSVKEPLEGLRRLGWL